MVHRVQTNRARKAPRFIGLLERLEQRLLFAADSGYANDPWTHEWVSNYSTVAIYAMADHGGTEQKQDTASFVGPPIDMDQQKHRELPDGSILDSQGLAYAKRPAFELGMLGDSGSGNLGTGGSGGGAPEGGGPPSNPGPIVPIYHSKPNAPKKIYLDFDGEMVTGTFWNNQSYTGSYNTGSVINAPAFSIDSDRSTFSTQELTVIREVWARMAEDFAPFQVDVTTEYPGDEVIYAGSQAIRVMISTDTDATTNQQWFPNAGGVAYLNSWTYRNGTPVWVFYNRLGTSNAKNIAEAGSHEVGHAFGLFHDGRSSPSEGYYWGHGSGQTGWAPIMGVGYGQALVQWSRGEYANANQTQDDLAIISSFVPYEPDDHGDTRELATSLSMDSQGIIRSSGLIATRGDKDAFQFFTQTGQVTLRVDPFELSTGKANLDAELKILDDEGNLVVTVNPPTRLDASVTLSLTKGTYTAIVDGVGKAAISGDQGYSDYASLGWYTLNGNVVRNLPPVLGLGNSTVASFEGETLTNQGTWSDPNPEDTVTLSASIGSIVKAADGTWQWSLPTQDQLSEIEVVITAIDDMGLITTATFVASAINKAPELTVSETSLAGSVLSVFRTAGTWNDVSSDTVTLNASHGLIEKKNDGTWAWEFRPSEILNDFVVTITGTDEDGGSSEVRFMLDAFAAVVNSNVYYKDSSFAITSVDAALDTNKVLAKSGATPQRLSFDNLINTTLGINGLVFDVAGLAAGSLTSADFTFRWSPDGLFNETDSPPSRWAAAPAPTSINVIAGTATSPARVRIEWANNAITDRWLQVRLLANANTGLPAPQTYYLGHLLGENDGNLRVNTFDVTPIVAARGQTRVPVGSLLDLDKNGRINTFDVTPAVSARGRSLRLITIPAAGSTEEGEGGFGGAGFAAPGVDQPQAGGSDSVGFGLNEIRARMTDDLFDVALPPVKLADLAESNLAPHIPESFHSESDDEDCRHMLSLDQYFEQIGRNLQ